MTYVDAGASVEGPGGVYTQTLPCFIGEPCTGPVVEGVPSNVVRSADGVHFCPVAEVDDRCPVYSSGAFRFAGAMVHARRSGLVPDGITPSREGRCARPRAYPSDGVHRE